MTDSLPEAPDIDPAALAATSFSRARKGFEPAEVHAVLGRTADALRIWQLRDAQQSEQLKDLTEQLSRSEELDEERLTAVLGEETARVISAARDAAAQIRSNAEEQAAALLAETESAATSAAEALKAEAATLRDEAARLRDDAASDATTIRTEAESSAAMTLADAQGRSEELLTAAESVLGARTAEADDVAAALIAAASADAEAAAEEAAALRESARQESLDEIERAREAGRTMVDETKALRERMLADLAERRLAARRQIEGALAARDRVAEVLRAAGTQLDETVDGLDRIDAEASVAADAAAEALEVDTASELAALHAELGIDPATEIAEVTPPEPDDAMLVTSSIEVVDEVVVVETDQGEVLVEHVESVERVETFRRIDDAPSSTEDSEPAVESLDSPDAQSPDAELADAELVGTELVETELVETELADETSPESDTGATNPFAAADADPGAEVIGIFDSQEERAETGAAELLASDPDLDDLDDELDDDDLDDESDAVDAADDDGDPSGPDGATVHDLFARIRAEEEHDVDGDPGPAGLDGGGLDGGELDGEEIDLTAPAAAASAGSAAASSSLGGGTEVAVRTDQDLLDTRDELLVPIEKSLSRALKRLASDEQNEILDKLRRVKRGRPEASTILPADDGSYTDHYIDALLPEFIHAVDAGATFWEEVAGSATDSLFGGEALVEDCLRTRVELFLSVHRAHLARTFSEADEADLDVTELGDRVRASYRDWRSTTLADLAGDLATAGFTHGERRAAGPGTPWQWVVDNGGLPCADGEDNALAGAVPCEEPFPTGDLTPPAHPGCRCILAPARR